MYTTGRVDDLDQDRSPSLTHCAVKVYVVRDSAFGEFSKQYILWQEDSVAY